MTPWKINGALIVAYLLMGFGWLLHDENISLLDNAKRGNLVAFALGLCIYLPILLMRRPDGRPLLRKGIWWVPFYRP